MTHDPSFFWPGRGVGVSGKVDDPVASDQCFKVVAKQQILPYCSELGKLEESVLKSAKRDRYAVFVQNMKSLFHLLAAGRDFPCDLIAIASDAELSGRVGEGESGVVVPDGGGSKLSRK